MLQRSPHTTRTEARERAIEARDAFILAFKQVFDDVMLITEEDEARRAEALVDSLDDLQQNAIFQLSVAADLDIEDGHGSLDNLAWALRQEAERLAVDEQYRDPNDEHRIGCFEAGVGRYGSWGR
jgi:hypothetical protein